MVSIIAAVAENGVIGRDGALPWHFPEDLALFREITTGNTVVMGRKTFESLPGPLPGRRNIILSRRSGYSPAGVEVAGSLDEALAAAEGEVFICGGASVFAEAFPLAQKIYLTLIRRDFTGDTTFPEIPADFRLVSEEPLPGALPAVFRVYRREEETR